MLPKALIILIGIRIKLYIMVVSICPPNPHAHRGVAFHRWLDLECVAGIRGMWFLS